MSYDNGRPNSQKSRQELLDEIYLLRDVAGERGAKLAECHEALAKLRIELDLIQRSRSWRMTAPLRWLTRLSGGRWYGVLSAKALRMRNGQSRPDKSQTPAEAQSGEDLRRDHPLLARHRAIYRSAEPSGRRLFVDVTELALREGRTGVQRVTRQILHALWASPPEGYDVEAVCAMTGQPYRLARRFAAKELGDADQAILEPLMQARSGDVFLGLDHAMDAVIEHAGELTSLHKAGVRIWFVCNDTLPLSCPEWFSPEVHAQFKAWFQTIACVGDGIACISQATEADVRHWIDALGIARTLPLALCHFHLGSEIDSNGATATVTQDQQTILDHLRGMPSFLMVGTLEPRKGHAQALEAFNILWTQGEDLALVLVGLPGWMTEVIQRRIRHHDEFGKRLFWFADANDALLKQLYEHCTALLATSEGEGLGLPLIEAARHGLPVLCRDLKVFREVAGEHATYFSGRDPASLVAIIRRWLSAYQREEILHSTGIPWITWQESAQQLLEFVMGPPRT